MDRDAKGLAIVIRSSDIRDYDKLLTLFSPSMGLIDIVSYGARKSVKSVKAPLYTEGNFSLEKGRRGWTLKDIDVISTHERILEDLDLRQSAMLFSDLVLLAKTAEPELYALYTSSIDALESYPFEKVVSIFITLFLSIEGLSGDYLTCPSCGREFGNDEVLGFRPDMSVAVCHDCDTLSMSLILPPNARLYLRRVQESGLDKALDFAISPEQEHRIFRYLLRCLLVSFPHRLKSLEFGIWRI